MIGSTIWIFDINRRVYRKDTSGHPIWREHWRPEVIAGETSRSWITKLGKKVPKKGYDARSVAFSQEAIDRAAFIHDNAYRIGEAVGRLEDHDLLQQIAALINYKPRTTL